MDLRFPPIAADRCLQFEHFPTPTQCMIYRNWELVAPQRIAKVLGITEARVNALASDMGLSVPARVHGDFLKNGYVTLTRANWHLLPYEQLCTLLDITPAKLSYLLAEDDFLDIKLGSIKPDTPPLGDITLNDAQKEQTKWIRRITEQTLAALPPISAEPFDFNPHFHDGVVGKPGKCDRFGIRMCASYCALYGDPFLDDELLTHSYPDALLEAYRDLGINALWTQAVLDTLTPSPFQPQLSVGYEKRLAMINKLIEKLGRYGIKLYLYLNEPRALDISFFRDHPELCGAKERGLGALCVCTEPVQKRLYDGAKFLAEHTPGLGGFLTITSSENLTNCYSRTDGTHTDCPRCDKVPPAEIFALVNRLLFEGARAAVPDFHMIAWTWGWPGWTIPDAIHGIDSAVDIMGVSEQAVKKNIGGVTTSVLDYSISVEGPGEYALATFAHARQEGHRTFAKIQANNSWEMSAVPYLPVFEKVYRHVSALIEKGKPDGLMLGWTLGGYPTPTLVMLRRLYEKSETLPTLSQLYAEMFPGADTEALGKAFHLFSEAFDNFPFDIEVAYHAPQHYAPSNLLFDTPTGFTATMVGQPYDDLDKWRSIYPAPIFIDQFRRVSDGWQKGLAVLKEALKDTEMTPTLQMLWDCALVCGNHFRSTYLECLFVRERNDGVFRDDIVAEEAELALSEAAVMAHNPTIGYESSNHYFYTRQTLLEKVLNCRYLLKKHGYESVPERF